jgi:deazaflavin-dependent oxidoreductase (nitroreductase family)
MGVPLFGQEHVDRYRETDGEEGHDWQGTTVLLLTTTGRNSGAKRTTPLIYQRHGDDYVVVASNGGGDPPGWFLNLQDDPIVALQVKADHHTARARVATVPPVLEGLSSHLSRSNLNDEGGGSPPQVLATDKFAPHAPSHRTR